MVGIKDSGRGASAHAWDAGLTPKRLLNHQVRT